MIYLGVLLALAPMVSQGAATVRTGSAKASGSAVLAKSSASPMKARMASVSSLGVTKKTSASNTRMPWLGYPSPGSTGPKQCSTCGEDIDLSDFVTNSQLDVVWVLVDSLQSDLDHLEIPDITGKEDLSNKIQNVANVTSGKDARYPSVAALEGYVTSQISNATDNITSSITNIINNTTTGLPNKQDKLPTGDRVAASGKVATWGSAGSTAGYKDITNVGSEIDGANSNLVTSKAVSEFVSSAVSNSVGGLGSSIDLDTGTNDGTVKLTVGQTTTDNILVKNVEVTTRKSGSITGDTGSTSKYPTVKAVEDYVGPISTSVSNINNTGLPNKQDKLPVGQRNAASGKVAIWGNNSGQTEAAAEILTTGTGVNNQITASATGLTTGKAVYEYVTDTVTGLGSGTITSVGLAAGSGSGELILTVDGTPQNVTVPKVENSDNRVQDVSLVSSPDKAKKYPSVAALETYVSAATSSGGANKQDKLPTGQHVGASGKVATWGSAGQTEGAVEILTTGTGVGNQITSSASGLTTGKTVYEYVANNAVLTSNVDQNISGTKDFTGGMVLVSTPSLPSP